MKRWLKALLVAGVTLVTFAFWTLIGSHQLEKYFRTRWNVGGPLSQAGGPRPDAYDHSAFLYYYITIGAILLATAVSVCLLVLLPQSRFKSRAWIYLMFIAVLLPASLYNYSQNDHIFPAHGQVILNLILIFLAATIALWLASFKPNAPDTQVLKSLALSLLLLGGVLVPAIFSLVWFFWAIGLLTKAQADQITFGHITGLSAAISCVITWLNYRREMRKESTDNGRIVRSV